MGLDQPARWTPRSLGRLLGGGLDISGPPGISERLHMALEAAGVGAWELDFSSGQTLRTPLHDRIFGYGSLQPRWGVSEFFSHVVEQDREAVRKRFETDLKGDVFSTECRIQWPDQSIHWIATQGKIFHDSRGEPAKMLGVVMDITERKRLERSLVAQHVAARALVESSTLAEATPKILASICQNLGWVAGVLWVVDPKSRVLRNVDVWHVPSKNIPAFEKATREIVFGPGVGLPGRVWSSGRPAWIPDVAKDANLPRALCAAKDDLHGAFGFPILSGERVSGVIEFFSGEIQRPDMDLLRMLGVIGKLIGSFIERRWAEESLQATNLELAAKLSELEQMNQIMMGREERIIELKEENKMLQRQLISRRAP